MGCPQGRRGRCYSFNPSSNFLTEIRDFPPCNRAALGAAESPYRPVGRKRCGGVLMDSPESISGLLEGIAFGGRLDAPLNEAVNMNGYTRGITA